MNHDYHLLLVRGHWHLQIEVDHFSANNLSLTAFVFLPARGATHMFSQI